MTLKLLAALLWYIGVYILLTKGSELAQDARELEPDKLGHYISWVAGIVLGVIKTQFIFIRSCTKNLMRIEALVSPKLWQFYRYRFFIGLAFMLMLGAFLSRAAQGSYTFLVAVSILDISIGTALLLSSWVFWKRGFIFSNKEFS